MKPIPALQPVHVSHLTDRPKGTCNGWWRWTQVLATQDHQSLLHSKVVAMHVQWSQARPQIVGNSCSHTTTLQTAFMLVNMTACEDDGLHQVAGIASHSASLFIGGSGGRGGGCNQGN